MGLIILLGGGASARANAQQPDAGQSSPAPPGAPADAGPPQTPEPKEPSPPAPPGVPARSFPAPAPAPPPPAPASPVPAPSYGNSAQPGATAPSQGPYQQVLGPYQRPPPGGAPKPELDERPTFARGEDPHRHNHDGLYLRLAVGIGGASDSLTGEGRKIRGTDPSSNGTFDGTATGFATATEIAIGVTAFPGFVIGAGIYTLNIPSPIADDAAGFQEYEFLISQLELFAAVADYYVNPKGGLHFQAGVGFAALVMGQAKPEFDRYNAHAYTATGAGVMLGAGYEWWVADDWGVGVLGRLMHGWVGARDSDAVDWSHGMLGYNLLLSVTYH